MSGSVLGKYPPIRRRRPPTGISASSPCQAKSALLSADSKLSIWHESCRRLEGELAEGPCRRRGCRPPLHHVQVAGVARTSISKIRPLALQSPSWRRQELRCRWTRLYVAMRPGVQAASTRAYSHSLTLAMPAEPYDPIAQTSSIRLTSARDDMIAGVLQASSVDRRYSSRSTGNLVQVTVRLRCAG